MVTLKSQFAWLHHHVTSMDMQVEEITLWTLTVSQDLIMSVHLSSKEERCT